MENLHFLVYIYFLKYILSIMLLQLSHFYLPFIHLHPELPPTDILLLQFMSMGRTYKFFGFCISHTILNLPLPILYLPIMLLIPCTFSPILPLPLLLITLHVISISVVLFLFQLFGWFAVGFGFWVHLLIVVNLLSFYC